MHDKKNELALIKRFWEPFFVVIEAGKMAGAGARDGLVSESEVREKNVAGGTFNGSQNDPVLIESVKIKLQCAREGGVGLWCPPPHRH